MSSERKFKEFMDSDAGAFARFKGRRSQRIGIPIFDIEPQSKRMSNEDRDKFQQAVADHMKAVNRRAFRGDVALKLDLSTTSKDAPQAHTIAKNFLDLLGAKRSNVKWPSRHLLYADDRQIQALFVSCRHGEKHPSILVQAQPFGNLIDDLELATKAIHDPSNQYALMHRDDERRDWLKTFRELRKEEKEQRAHWGDDFYDAYLKMVRVNAQKAALLQSAVDIPVIGWMYGLPRGINTRFSKDIWPEMLSESKLRLQVGELPFVPGSSNAFGKSVAEEIKAFKERWDWLMSPLVVAVALEVIVRPNPKTTPNVLHDLDNVVRDYLIPGIVPSFGTVSDHRWTIDFKDMAKRHPELDWGPSPMPPTGTKWGVTRYEAWRLPPVENTKGFVSVALVADMDAEGDRVDQINRCIKDWAKKKLGDDRRRGRRFL
jgi:hypothetical protein